MALTVCPDCSAEVSDRAPACPKCGSPIAAAAAAPTQSAQTSPPLPAHERVLLSEGYVSVSTSRFVVGSQTYPMANVSSVKSFTAPAKTGFPILLLVVGIIAGFSAFANKEALVVAIPLIALGIFLLRAAKPTFYVALTTASGEVRPVGSKDQAYVERIITALNEAVVARG
jgi:hypothetical protein